MLRRRHGSYAVCLLILTLISAVAANAQRTPAAAGTTTQSAAISGISYVVTFDAVTALTRTIKVDMSFSVPAAAGAPVILSLPAWTPGAYEISYFSKYVTKFAPTGDGKPLQWDKLDYDTWRLQTGGAKSVTVSAEFLADTLDNAMAWARRDFVLFNGTNIFLFPEGRGFNFGATVSVRTAPGWLVATGMTPGSSPRSYSASNYHDLVDMPFFVGRFDYDSTRIADRWVRLATYPTGSLAGQARAQVWEQLQRMIPPEVAVFGEAPFQTYTVFQITDSSYAGASGLEHQNSHVDVITPLAIGSPFMPSLYAHEVFHAWNVKRLRPSDLWPYQYAEEQPTTWLWVSEGVTDYYADLALVRGGIIDSAGFFAATTGKIQEVFGVPAVSLEDASLSTWSHPVDGTGYIYYPKGSLAGFMLDIMIRDASDNRRSLDDVMRQLYRETYKQGRGFTGEQWWRAVSAAAGGKSFADFNTRYIDGREPFPWGSVLPLAAMRLVADTVREPRLGVNTIPDTGGVLIVAAEPAGAAATAGVEPGDYLVSVGGIPVTDQTFGARFRADFANREGTPLAIVVRRGGQNVTLNATVQLQERLEMRIEPDSAAPEKAVRIRSGILKGSGVGSRESGVGKNDE